MRRKSTEAKTLRNTPNARGAKRIKSRLASSYDGAFGAAFPESETSAVAVAADSGPSTVSAGFKIRGEFFGNSDLFIDGEAQGKIRVPGARVTIAASGRVVADIDAREIIIDGSAQGNMRATENIRLGPSSRVQGSLVTLRIGIEDGARLRGKIQMTRLPDSQSSVSLENPSGAEVVGKVCDRAENE